MHLLIVFEPDEDRYLRLYGLSLLISEGCSPQIKWPNVARSIAVNCSTTSLRFHIAPKIAALILAKNGRGKCKHLWLPSCYLVCSISGEYNGDKDLFRAPIWQSPQVSQCTQISGSYGLKFSLCHFSHQWAQRQDLICSQLSHWTERLYSVNKKSTVRARNNDDPLSLRLIFLWAL